MPNARPDLLSVARRLRENQTSAERRLWSGLRRQGVEGFAFAVKSGC